MDNLNLDSPHKVYRDMLVHFSSKMMEGFSYEQDQTPTMKRSGSLADSTTEAEAEEEQLSKEQPSKEQPSKEQPSIPPMRKQPPVKKSPKKVRKPTVRHMSDRS
jgi:hypothetical protein